LPLTKGAQLFVIKLTEKMALEPLDSYLDLVPTSL